MTVWERCGNKVLVPQVLTAGGGCLNETNGTSRAITQVREKGLIITRASPQLPYKTTR